ncbi:hypothetical protein WA026_023549 [Henosepilachna vigintioctopunctata]|uniref:TIR domain-containing protein n=1 Tax=Henosepilachna vigintioctopunctata TaxID=420089 RepID=A0AAW1UTJ8_9CUCU
MLSIVFPMFLLLSMQPTEETEQVNCHTFKHFALYNYVCPPNSQKRIEVAIKPTEHMILVCFEMTNFDNAILPNLNFSSTLIKVSIQNCPIPKNGFKKFLDEFNIAHFVELTFIWKYSNETLEKENFEGLNQLTELVLYRNNLASIDTNLFEHTPNLRTLKLSENNLTKLQNDIFKNLNNLLYLTIAENKISELSRYAFRGLRELRELDFGNNKLREIPSGVFQELVNLKVLYLNYNKLFSLGVNPFSTLKNLIHLALEGNMLTHVSRKYFENNEKLSTINLAWNTNLTFEDKTFSLFNDLVSVLLSNSGIRSVPENLLRGTTNVFDIDLQNNRIPSMPENLFSEMKSLHDLYLNYNEIKSLHPNQFQHLKNLINLDLSHNLITSIDKHLLNGVERLETLILSFNRLKMIHPEIFLNKPNLVILLLNNNKLESVDNSLAALEGSKYIKMINLANNDIADFPYKLMKFLMKNENKYYYATSTEVISHFIESNTIEIYLGNNSISNIRLDYLRPGVMGYNSILEVNISHNPINCDCKASDLVENIHRSPRDGNVILKYDSLRCAGPPDFKNMNLSNLLEKKLTCTLNKNCTTTGICDCIYESKERTLIVDCSRRNITLIPNLLVNEMVKYYDFIKMKHLDVHLEENSLQEVPTEANGYHNVTNLYLQGNRISNIEWIPPSIEVLNIENNSINKFDNSLLNMLNQSNVKKLFLRNNPWECDCTTKEFQKFIREHISQIHNATDILCHFMEVPLVNLDESMLCPIRRGYTLVILSVLLFCLIAIIISVLLCLIYQNEILIWCYSKDICMRFIKEERIDRSKKYDAFVSYAQQDQDFVMKQLVPKLEEADPPYKLCIHVRDWIPGEFITKQIANSVKDSRRTLIVLSNSFLKSMWGRMEFRTAHTAAMEEGRVRVIIIIYGDLDANSVTDDFKSYMRTNTYVEWGDPCFWEKLKDALPRRYKKQKRRTRDSNEQDIELH